MKITKSKLKEIIKEELGRSSINEEDGAEEIEIFTTGNGSVYALDPRDGEPDLRILGSGRGDVFLMKGSMKHGHEIIDPTTLEPLPAGKSIPPKMLQRVLQRYYAKLDSEEEL